MRPEERDWIVRLEDILTAIEKVQTYTRGMTFEQFASSPMAMEAVFHNLTVIGEAARFVPPDIVARHADVPWNEMRGMRNVLVHEYFGARLETVWDTIQRDLPPLVPKLRSILDETPPDK